MSSIYVYGASGHGLVVADIAKACGYDIVLFIDDGDNAFPTFLETHMDKEIPLVFGIGHNLTRAKLFTKVKQCGFHLISLIHPSAVVSPDATIGEGTVIMPQVVVNANAVIAEGAILNTGSIVEHECCIGKFVHISPNVALAGNVTVGDFTHIGIGSNVIQGIIIGHNSIIGAGSVVVKNIRDFTKAFGIPCKEVEAIDE